MPAPLHSHSYSSLFVPNQQAPSTGHNGPQVHVYHRDKNAIADIHRTLTVQEYSEPHLLFNKVLDEEVRGGKKRSNLSIYFESVSTWGEGDGHTDVKTLGTALWRRSLHLCDTARLVLRRLCKVCW